MSKGDGRREPQIPRAEARAKFDALDWRNADVPTVLPPACRECRCRPCECEVLVGLPDNEVVYVPELDALVNKHLVEDAMEAAMLADDTLVNAIADGPSFIGDEQLLAAWDRVRADHPDAVVVDASGDTDDELLNNLRVALEKHDVVYDLGEVLQ